MPYCKSSSTERCPGPDPNFGSVLDFFLTSISLFAFSKGSWVILFASDKVIQPCFKNVVETLKEPDDYPSNYELFGRPGKEGGFAAVKHP
jgi:hypothetical protein